MFGLVLLLVSLIWLHLSFVFSISLQRPTAVIYSFFFTNFVAFGWIIFGDINAHHCIVVNSNWNFCLTLSVHIYVYFNNVKHASIILISKVLIFVQIVRFLWKLFDFIMKFIFYSFCMKCGITPLLWNSFIFCLYCILKKLFVWIRKCFCIFRIIYSGHGSLEIPLWMDHMNPYKNWK